nr:alpha/beta hydrolase [Rhizobium sp. SSA_523]
MAQDGVPLGYRLYGSQRHGLPVVCLPGLTRNARDFDALATFLASPDGGSHWVICPDYRGRGTSGRAHDAGTYTIAMECQDLILLLDQLGIQQAGFIGTSRGGLILHILTSLQPQRVAALVLNDVGPVLELQGLRDIQAYLKDPPLLNSWDAAAAHLKKAHGPAFPRLGDQDWQDWAQAVYVQIASDQDADAQAVNIRAGNPEAVNVRAVNAEAVNAEAVDAEAVDAEAVDIRAGGAIIADCDPAIATAFAAAPLDTPLPDLWAQFDLFADIPILVVRGENSSLLSPATIAAMQARRPGLQSLTAQGQGHAPLLHLDGLDKAIAATLAQATPAA